MYKTIIVHVDGSAAQESRLQAAALLARAHDAHVVGAAATGISWVDFALLTGGMGPPMPIDDFDSLRATATLRLVRFSEQAARLGMPMVETRVIENMPDYGLVLQSRYADLVVVSRDDEAEPALSGRVRRLPERLALRGARPVLVVPQTYEGAPMPGTVVAGWDGSRQAIRALDAALPLLVCADSVKLALVNPEQLPELHGEQPGADMALYLARHGVKVDVVVDRTTLTVGQSLMALTHDCGAD